MTSVVKKAIQDSLELKCYNLGRCIVALAVQGYLVNNSKWFRLKMNLILQEQLKYIDSFTDSVQNRITNVFNNLG